MSDPQQVEDRKTKREKLRELGVAPYGSRFPDVQAMAAVRQAGEKLGLEPGQHEVFACRKPQ